MSLSFLTPAAALVGVAVVLALAVLLSSERRSRALCAVLGLTPRPRSSLAVDAGALAAVGLLLGLATAQPIVSRVQTVDGRSDAELIVVLDISRSMLAREGARGATRLDRARELAKELRAGVPEVPVGVASLTDRVLPHLFPTLGQNAFAATVDRAIGIERPPPDRRSAYRATALGAIGDLGRQNFFGRGARARVAVVFTDGESVPVDAAGLRERLLAGRVRTVFVHVWRPDERVLGAGGAPEPYRPDPQALAALQRIATNVEGEVFPEERIGSALAAARRGLGDGPLAPRGRDLRAVALAPWAVAAAALPLLVVLRRRNL